MMRRYFFIAEKLEDIENVESSMKMQGFADNQYHVLSNDDSNAEKRQLHDVSSIFKQDVVHSAEMGAMVGAGVAVFIILLAWLAGWTSGAFGWAPFVALALLAFCFCTWEGAFLGIQIPNRQFRRFNRVLQEGKHVFFVDLDEHQLKRFEPVMRWHPELKEAGADIGWPRWLQRSSHNVKEMVKTLP